jgi:DNA-directed RNA polymerase specialized sigma24 family protein
MDPKELSTKELLRLCLENQDPAAWQEFARRTQPRIAGTIVRTFRRYGSTPSPSQVDDLVQDTYTDKLFANNAKALRDFKCHHDDPALFDAFFFGFLKTVASRVAIDYLRRPAPDEVVPSPILPAPTPNPDRQVLLDQIIRRLYGLKHEPNFQRDLTIFLLYFVHGLTAKAISRLPGIGLTVKGVESVLLRLLRYLRGDLNGPDDDD